MEARLLVFMSPLDDADAELWLRLFVRLEMTLAAAVGPEARRVFRALGPRRFANAHKRLVNERQKLALEMVSIGVCPLEERMQPSPGPPSEDGLEIEFAKLAEAFANCAPVAQRLGRVALNQWLLERASMHQQHALFLCS